MTSLFCGTTLAARIEAAEAAFIAAATAAAGGRGAPGIAHAIAGGYACFAEDGSPMNKVVGLGFGGVPDAAAWGVVERALPEPVAVELSTLADPEIAGLLTRRGHAVVGFENVLGRPLEGVAPAGGRDVPVEVRIATDDELDAWVDVVVDGFAHPDGEGAPTHESFPRDVIARAERDVTAAGAGAYLAWCDGAVAGGGSMRITDGIAQLTGAATAPAFRRRGVQAALLAARLRDAAEAGCDVAVVTTAPGSTSQKNVQRNGFDLLYARLILAR